MYNPINHALSNIYSKIPQQILELCFRKYDTMLPIDQIIVNKIISAKVLIDLNLVGGKVKNIPLLQSYHEVTTFGLSEAITAEGHYSLYRIPPEARDNLPITAVTQLTFPSNISSSMGIPFGNFGNSVGDMANEVLESHTQANSYTTPLPEILAGDLIRINPPQHSHIDWICTVRLNYESDLSSLNQSAVLSFSKLSVLAVKAFIYNDLIIQIDEVAMRTGVSVGAIKDIILSYADADKEYDELLEEDMTGAVILEPIRMNSILRNML